MRRSRSLRTRFEARVRAMPGEGFAGANVTVPHKGAALAVADQAVGDGARDRRREHADLRRRRGPRREHRRRWAAERAPGLAGRRAGRWCSGAGGAGRAVVWALVREGAEVEVWNRTELRSRHLCEELGGRPVADPEPGSYELIVNTTAVGLSGEDPFEELPLSAERFSEGQVVVDMVYGEQPSRLLGAAADAGATVVDGIEVLVQQGALSFRIWTGREAPVEAMRAAARA